MLWEVENTNLRILGSVHVSDRPLDLSPLATLAISEADTLAFETNIEVTPNLSATRYKTGGSLSQNIPVPLFADTMRMWCEFGFNEEELEGLRPWWVAFRLMNSLMSKHGFVYDQGIELKVLHYAKVKKKCPFFLETVDAGLAPFATAPVNEQEIFLSRIVQYTDEEIHVAASLVAAWESGNPATLLPIVERGLKLMPITYSNTLANRNKSWLRHFLRLAQSHKKTVAIVGALHMVGPESIPSLLAASGLTCSLLKAEK